MTEPLVTDLAGHHPDIAADAWIAPTTVVVGRVRVASRSSVWYGSVLRGDEDQIAVGSDCNIQDCCVLHADEGEPCILGDRVSLGHRAIVHGAHVDDDVLVGMGAVVLNRARVGSWSFIAAGAVVREGFDVPSGVLVAGVPAKVVREINDPERDTIRRTTESYLRKSSLHRAAVG